MRPAAHARAAGRARGTWGRPAISCTSCCPYPLMPRVRAACGRDVGGVRRARPSKMSFFFFLSLSFFLQVCRSSKPKRLEQPLRHARQSMLGQVYLGGSESQTN